MNTHPVAHIMKPIIEDARLKLADAHEDYDYCIAWIMLLNYGTWGREWLQDWYYCRYHPRYS